VRFSTISGTLPSIDNIFTDFRDVLKAREILDLDSFLLAIAEDKTIPARALSNIPNMSIYLYERYKNGFLFFPRTRTNKAISRFMENGFPTTIFNPVSQKREFIFTKDDFEKLAPVVLDKHPVLQKWTYS
jgi:hypothetical protein